MKENNNLNIENENQDTEKKAKKKWSKKKKAGVSCLVIVLLAAITAFNFLIVAPTLYLSFKYLESPFKYRLSTFESAQFYRADNKKGDVFDQYDTYLSNPVWTYKLGDENISVKFNNKKFRYYDFRQLEEIEQLATEYLQTNIDGRISGIQIDEEHLFAFGNRRVTEKNIERFLFDMDYRYYRPSILIEDGNGWRASRPIIYTYADKEIDSESINDSFNKFKAENSDFWNDYTICFFIDDTLKLEKYIQTDDYFGVKIRKSGMGYTDSKYNYLYTQNKIETDYFSCE